MCQKLKPGDGLTLEKFMNSIDVDFMADEWYDHHRRKVVWFRAVADEKVIDCGISIDALADHFGAYHDDPLPAFKISTV